MEARTATADGGAAGRVESSRHLWRWVQALGPARLLTVSGLLVAGALLVTAGGLLRVSDYLGAALLEIGAALLLAVPLILLERLLSVRIKDVKAEFQDQIEGVAEEVHRAQTKIDQLGDETRSRIAAARESDAELLRRLRADASEANVWRALHRAQELAALDDDGVRVRIPNASLRMRFKARAGDSTTAGPVDIAVEDRDGRPVSGSECWSADESAADALVALADDLWRRGAYPNDERFDASEIFDDLADTLGTLFQARTNGRKGGPLGPLVELRGDWALTRDGLEHVADGGRAVRTRRLLDDREAARGSLAAADGDDEALDDMLETAVQYHMGVAQRRADRRAPPR